MPYRVSADRRKESDLPAWRMLFETGYDFFDALPEIGIETDPYSRPDRGAVEEAWNQLGAEFLEVYAAEQAAQRRPNKQDPWALTEFGPPKPPRERRRYTY